MNHLFGRACERLFDVECARRGLNVGLGMGAVDRVVLTKDGRLLRVQVKSTRKLARFNKGWNGKKLRCFSIANRRESVTKETFSEAGVDYIAAYVKPQRRWYIFRAEECRGNRILIRMNPTGRAKEAVERWDRLGYPDAALAR